MIHTHKKKMIPPQDVSFAWWWPQRPSSFGLGSNAM